MIMEDRVHNHIFDGKSNNGIKEFGAGSSLAPVKIKIAKTKKFDIFEKTVCPVTPSQPVVFLLNTKGYPAFLHLIFHL